MSNFARSFGLFLASAMAIFSAYNFFTTWDWVAAAFFLGSIGYLAFFASRRMTNR
jgi:hypothetical protein